MRYDLFFQNNGSKEVYVVTGVEDKDSTDYVINFEEFPMPEEMVDGEYTYVVFANTLPRENYEYELDDVLLDSIIVIDGEQRFSFKDLKPLIGLMRIGQVEQNMIINNDREEYYIYGE